MTIDEITSEVRKGTYGLLNDGEVVYVVELCLASHGGIDPDDIAKVRVNIRDSAIDIQFLARDEQGRIIDLASP